MQVLAFQAIRALHARCDAALISSSFAWVCLNFGVRHISHIFSGCFVCKVLLLMLFVWLNVGFTKVVIYSFIYLLEAYSPVIRTEGHLIQGFH